WVANTGTNSLSRYTIDSDGILTLTGTHNTAAFGRAPFEIVQDPTGRFLYELNTAAAVGQNIHLLRVDSDSSDAGLLGIATYDLPPSSAPIGLAVISPGR